MYCPECGNKIEDGNVLFCSECGTKLERDVHTMNKDSMGSSSSKEAGIHGLLFTNLNLLAEKLDVDEQSLTAVFDKFIVEKRKCGVSYKLVDAGNYSYGKSGFFGKTRTVSLNADSSLWDYMDILMDVHQREKAAGKEESQYLFIIGGSDIIPMPCVRHYIPDDSNDDSIDTDILYAYPYGKEMLALLESQEIFKYEQLFFVGRLPFGEDASCEDLLDYLKRDIENSHGIPMIAAYGQCDPNWKNVSVRVAGDLLSGNYLRNFDGRLPADCYYNRLILSPMVMEENVSQVFHAGASLYYYNLHGGEGLESRGYFGAMLHKSGEGAYPVIEPEHMMTCLAPNIVISEACYGGRFIGLDRYHSMLLASLSANTLAFVGSSRVAWGSVDSLNATPSTVALCEADIIASCFMNAVLQGYTVAQALFIARSALLQGTDQGSLYSALTIVEFNLFGDPTLSMNFYKGGKSEGERLGKKALVPEDAKIGCTVERIKLGNRSGSILEQVRSAVDGNILQIHTMINQYLYANYGVTPREVDGIFKVRYKDGQEELQFNYDMEAQEGKISARYVITTTVGGEIKRVYTAK